MKLQATTALGTYGLIGVPSETAPLLVKLVDLVNLVNLVKAATEYGLERRFATLVRRRAAPLRMLRFQTIGAVLSTKRAPEEPLMPEPFSDPNAFRSLCRRRGCCPQIAFDFSNDSPWEAAIVETGSSDRRPGKLVFTHVELVELARVLKANGYLQQVDEEAL